MILISSSKQSIRALQRNPIQSYTFCLVGRDDWNILYKYHRLVSSLSYTEFIFKNSSLQLSWYLKKERDVLDVVFIPWKMDHRAIKPSWIWEAHPPKCHRDSLEIRPQNEASWRDNGGFIIPWRMALGGGALKIPMYHCTSSLFLSVIWSKQHSFIWTFIGCIYHKRSKW